MALVWGCSLGRAGRERKRMVRKRPEDCEEKTGMSKKAGEEQ